MAAARPASDAATVEGYDQGKLLAGILLVLLAQREEQAADGAVKSEVLLNKAGFSGLEIATLTGKNVGAVQKSIQRSRR